MNNQMAVGSFLKFGIENAKRHFFRFLGLHIFSLIVLISVLFTISEFDLLEHKDYILCGLLYTFLFICISFGFLKNMINLCRGERVKFLAFIKVKPVTVLYYIAVTALCAVIICIGFCLFIVPGIILCSMLFIAPLLVIDRNMKPIKAILMSIKLTKGYRIDIYFGFVVSAVVAVLISLVTFNWLFMLPMILLVYIYPYLILTSQIDDAKKFLEENY